MSFKAAASTITMKRKVIWYKAIFFSFLGIEKETWSLCKF